MGGGSSRGARWETSCWTKTSLDIGGLKRVIAPKKKWLDLSDVEFDIVTRNYVKDDPINAARWLRTGKKSKKLYDKVTQLVKEAIDQMDVKSLIDFYRHIFVCRVETLIESSEYVSPPMVFYREEDRNLGSSGKLKRLSSVEIIEYVRCRIAGHKDALYIFSEIASDRLFLYNVRDSVLMNQVVDKICKDFKTSEDAKKKFFEIIQEDYYRIYLQFLCESRFFDLLKEYLVLLLKNEGRFEESERVARDWSYLIPNLLVMISPKWIKGWNYSHGKQRFEKFDIKQQSGIVYFSDYDLRYLFNYFRREYRSAYVDKSLNDYHRDWHDQIVTF